MGALSLGARIKHASALVNYLQMRYLTIAERRTHESFAAREASAAVPEETGRDTIPVQLDLLQRAYAGIPVILLVIPFTPRIEGRDIEFQGAAQKQLIRTIRVSLDWKRTWKVVEP